MIKMFRDIPLADLDLVFPDTQIFVPPQVCLSVCLCQIPLVPVPRRRALRMPAAGGGLGRISRHHRGTLDDADGWSANPNRNPTPYPYPNPIIRAPPSRARSLLTWW